MTTISKPKALTIIPDNIPLELQAPERWLVSKWTWVEKRQTWTKPPLGLDGRNVSATDPNSWMSFAKALNAVRSGRFDFIGRAWAGDEGISVLDIDHCVEWSPDSDSPDISPMAEEIVRELDSYTEISPSGTGLRIILKAAVPEHGRKKMGTGLQIQDRGLYTTITGHHLPGTPTTIEPRQVQLDALRARIFGPDEEAPKPPPLPATHAFLDDNEVIEKALNAANGYEFRRLWEGDINGFPSQSEADYSLIGRLLWWCNGNQEQADRLFRVSGLYRDKWDARNGYYRNKTLARAMGDFKGGYSPSTNGHHNGPLSDAASPPPPPPPTRNGTMEEPPGHDTPVVDSPYPLMVGAKHGTFSPSNGGRNLLSTGMRVARGGAQLYVYSNGTYQPGEKEIKALLADQLGTLEMWQPGRVSGIVDFLMDSAPDLWESPPLDVLNLANGLLDRKTGELRPHDPDFLSPVQCPVSFDPDAECPAIETFIRQVVPEDAVRLVYELAGLLLFPDTGFQRAALFLGSGANGKGTLLRLFMSLLGHANVSSHSLQTLSVNRFAAADLYGKLANIAGDLPNTRIEDSSTFKTLTGEDWIQAERKLRDSFQFKPYARLVFSANEIPGTRDATHGYLRRWIVLRFPNSFPPDKRDRDLDVKLRKPEELSGFLNLALLAYEDMKERGEFSLGQAASDGAQELAEVVDPVRTFARERLVFQREGASTPKAMVYKEYRRWSEDQGRGAYAARTFYERLSGVMPLEVKTVRGTEHFSGIVLVDESFE